MIRCKARVLLAALSLAAGLGGAAAQAQPVQVSDWNASLAGSTGVALAVDATDSSYVLGITAPTSFDAGVGTLVLSRYGRTGALQWTRSWFPTGYAGARPTAVVADTAGNAYVLGAYDDFNYTVSSLGGGGGPIGVFDAGWLVQKYGPDGTLLWTRRTLGVGSRVKAGVTDAAGNLYVLVSVGGGRLFATERIAADSGATVWSANSEAVPGGEVAGDLLLTPTGQVVSAGAGASGLSLVAYAADSGGSTWSNRLVAAAGSYAPGLGLGPNGELLVTGLSGAELYLAAFDAAYVPRIAQSYPQATRGLRVAADAQGRIVVSGIGSSPTNWVTLVLDGAGNLVQPPAIVDRHATSNETPNGLLLRGDGTLFVAGSSGPGSATDPLATRATTIRYLPAGGIAWQASAPDARAAVAIRGLTDGSVVVLGDTAQTLLHYPLASGPTPTALSLAGSTIKGGRSTTGRVTLSSSAGAVVSLVSGNPALVSVPASVTVAAGSNTASFTVTTARVRSNTAVTLTARANGGSAVTVLTLTR